MLKPENNKKIDIFRKQAEGKKFPEHFFVKIRS